MLGIVEYLPHVNGSRQVGDLLIGSIHLIPGNNEVDIDEWDASANHPLIQQRIQQGIIRVTFAQPAVIVVPDNGKKEKVPRIAAPIETKLNAEPTVGVIEPIIPLPIEPEKPFAKK